MGDQTLTGKEETEEDTALSLEMRANGHRIILRAIVTYSNSATQAHIIKTKQNKERSKTCTQNYTQLCVATTPPLCGEEKGLVVATSEF